MAKKKPDEEAYIRYRNLNIPVNIYFENRRNTRISIGTTRIHLRLPGDLTQSEFEDQIRWADRWLQKHLSKSPGLVKRFEIPQFKNGDRIQILHDVFVLHLNLIEEKHNGNATLKGKDIFITISQNAHFEDRNKSIQLLIHKILCERYADFTRKRVAELNARFVKEKYKRVKLKYIHSKWGSCSHDGEIILSSKLLLCPEWIRDYVIIHELVHLIEQNHSDAFWSIVEDILPDYRKADEWLNDEGAGIELYPMPVTAWPTYPKLKQKDPTSSKKEKEGSQLKESQIADTVDTESENGTQLTLF